MQEMVLGDQEKEKQSMETGALLIPKSLWIDVNPILFFGGSILAPGFQLRGQLQLTALKWLEIAVDENKKENFWD